MSHKTLRYLYCDGPLCQGRDEPFTTCPAVNCPIREQREEARRQGWQHIHGKDYCPECLVLLAGQKGAQL